MKDEDENLTEAMSGQIIISRILYNFFIIMKSLVNRT